jgi:hypothetical protein
MEKRRNFAASKGNKKPSQREWGQIEKRITNLKIEKGKRL